MVSQTAFAVPDFSKKRGVSLPFVVDEDGWIAANTTALEGKTLCVYVSVNGEWVFHRHFAPRSTAKVTFLTTDIVAAVKKGDRVTFSQDGDGAASFFFLSKRRETL